MIHGPLALAAADEIQVYLDDINAPGEAALELSLNYVPKDRRTPDYPGEIPPHHVFRVMPEISLGLAPNWDLGLYRQLQANPDGNLHSKAIATTRSAFYLLRGAE